MSPRRPGPLPAAASPNVTPAWPCLSAGPENTSRLDISVQPSARRTAADGLHDGALRVRLAAPPVDGKANAQLTAWLADELGVAKRAVTLLRGEASRRKQLAIALPAPRVAAWLDTLGLLPSD